MMDAVDCMKAVTRMLKSGTIDYAIQKYISAQKKNDYEGMVEAAEQWAAEHPVKTLQSVFLKMLPNVPLNDKGQPAFCPKLLDTEYHPVGSCCLDVDICQRCMDNFWGQEVEDV